jgi:hypothetical protein
MSDGQLFVIGGGESTNEENLRGMLLFAVALRK